MFTCSLQCPVLVAWGDKDPWEPIDLGKAYAQFDSVEDFIVLPNVGHCPQVASSLLWWFSSNIFNSWNKSASDWLFWGVFLQIKGYVDWRELFQLKDEAPHLVNPLIASFVAQHAPPTSAL